MGDGAEGGVGRDAERAGAQRHVRIGDADQVDEERHGEDGAAAADEPEDEPDEATRGAAQQILPDGHRPVPVPVPVPSRPGPVTYFALGGWPSALIGSFR